MSQAQKKTKAAAMNKKKSPAKPADSFFSHFKKHVSTSDWLRIGDADMGKLIKNLYGWVEKRQAKHHKIRVYNVDEKIHGWQCNNTVIEIINDDMPFLIDSVASELGHQNFQIAYLFHPVLAIDRKKSGLVEKVGNNIEEARLRGGLESVIHIQLEQFLPASACAHLEKQLSGILDDVRLATTDWKLMLARLRDVINTIDIKQADGGEHEHNIEAIDFLEYVYKNNFTLLGYREYQFAAGKKSGDVDVRIAKDSALGLLREGHYPFDVALKKREYEQMQQDENTVVVSKWIDQYSTVHRRVPFDVINVKVVDNKGRVIGQHVFIGLFTSSTYSCRTLEVPLVRKKVRETLALAKFGSDSHDRKALEHILEKYPRDELFQVSVAELTKTSIGILDLQERQRVALFARKDPLERYVSCLVYIPRDIYDTRFRRSIETVLEARLQGVCTNYHITLDDSPLARGLFTILTDPEQLTKFDAEAVEQELIEIGQSWQEKLGQELINRYGKKTGAVYAHSYAEAFPPAYQDNYGIIGAVKDIPRIETLLEQKDLEIAVDLYQDKTSAGDGTYHLKIYHQSHPVRLSDIMTALENMGLDAISEMPFKVRPGRGTKEPVWVHDFLVSPRHRVSFELEEIKEVFEKAFLRIWDEVAENDALNELVLQAGLNWREVLIVRSYTSYLKQARFAYSRRYLETVLTEHAEAVRDLVGLYKALHNPKLAAKKRAAEADKFRGKLEARLNDVTKLDHDRILRAYWTLVEKTLRTNYYQRDENGKIRPCLSVKLDSKNIDFVPRPRPHVEIFVYSARVEAVHLRGGKIARGGIRWSDRHDDFRTEILGLMKAQMVKNAVIVPVGAKGGFIVKNPPTEGGRDAFLAEGIACYQLFVQSLLDLTDNNNLGKIEPPANTVRYDDDDPYLVVAADKGTATFSDIANKLSTKAGFWLDDAFASGGSAGYDHKVMGITARGAWESVKRHFREMGKDIQKEDFTAIGVGDMGGDVFGNGMLLSKHTRLVGAFNHLHIFCDPDPDAAASFKERQRLFKARGGWDQYDKSKISKGGAVYLRSEKSLTLTPEIKACFDIRKDKVTPDELMHAMLKTDVELLWFGGIGTFVKSAAESHADADDRSNDAVRVNGREIRAAVIGEGANLGMTQDARVEYAHYGGRLNTDFIDNSAGVDCSDHEVNIKILLNAVERNTKHKMSRAKRNTLLEKMTDEVGSLVLDDNYQQNQALSMAEYRAAGQLSLYGALLRDFEKQGVFDRKLEHLPDEETIGRMLQDNRGLTRPELSVVLSYTKIVLFQNLLESDLPDEKGMEDWLDIYFPKPLEKYRTEILNHGLRREIIATMLANALVNRMGPVFIKSREAKTGAGQVAIVKAFLIMMRAFDVPKLWDAIEALDNKVPSKVQISALSEIYILLKHTITWLLRRPRPMGSVTEEVAQLSKGITEISGVVRDLIPHYVRDRVEARRESLKEQGMPDKLATDIASIRLLDAAPDIINIDQSCKGSLKAIAGVYFDVGQVLRLDWLRQQCLSLKTENHWQARALSGMVDEFYKYQALLTEKIATEYGCSGRKGDLGKWQQDHEEKLQNIEHLVSEIDRSPAIDIPMLMLAAQAVRQFTE
ncbi:MAG: NAD-glutamate dehydrogenase [Pseudomonadota bacterium]|nr:NAD-glutamate dehydrogenase [Pseudomonadota bacterium]QKK05218.1 MAG: NAD-glutamate dehydrogenase [Pseudomonadota bacterium]